MVEEAEEEGGCFRRRRSRRRHPCKAGKGREKTGCTHAHACTIKIKQKERMTERNVRMLGGLDTSLLEASVINGRASWTHRYLALLATLTPTAHTHVDRTCHCRHDGALVVRTLLVPV